MEQKEVIFEESLSDDWAHDFDVVEVPLNERPFFMLGIAIILVGLAVCLRILYLNVSRGDFYGARAESNLFEAQPIPAPRGQILDRFHKVLADNASAFSVYLDAREFVRDPESQDKTLKVLNQVLGSDPSEVLDRLQGSEANDLGDIVPLTTEAKESQIVALMSSGLKTIIVKDGFIRVYPYGPEFSSLIGYTGMPNVDDIKANPEVATQDVVGRTGLESFYDDSLRGKLGLILKIRDAKGKILGEDKKVNPEIGKSLRLTIDSEFQKYFYNRFTEALAVLGRTTGVGLAINPQNGEVLAYMNFPSYDNNVFSAPNNGQKRQAILTSQLRPLFNRAVSGFYNPGSTIKPLHGVAALKEGVVSPEKTVFSPGYLDVPNPYDPQTPTRYLDWRYQGTVNLASAIAQSSNVYFYAVGGGAFDIKGLGISRLHEWWQKFNLGSLTGIDMPGEAKGFLPDIDWKERTTHHPWLLGDTYNVAIGQGDLLLTPIQLLDYIAAIGNGGKIYKPVLNIEAQHPQVVSDLSSLHSEISKVKKGMIQTVEAKLGTAYLLHDLPFSIGAKTGSAQVQNNAKENAFFVGYAPAENPQIAILVLIENSKEGSLNAVPVAKDVLAWYYENRIKK